MNCKEYSVDAAVLSFLFYEMRKSRGVMAEGQILAEIKQLNKEENILNATIS